MSPRGGFTLLETLAAVALLALLAAGAMPLWRDLVAADDQLDRAATAAGLLADLDPDTLVESWRDHGIAIGAPEAACRLEVAPLPSRLGPAVDEDDPGPAGFRCWVLLRIRQGTGGPVLASRIHLAPPALCAAMLAAEGGAAAADGQRGAP
ncbi:MAG: prepilin-type N-terminal cleavage/methylation domain-containing protein [Planctomycetota bacterium]